MHLIINTELRPLQLVSIALYVFNFCFSERNNKKQLNFFLELGGCETFNSFALASFENANEHFIS